MASEKTPGDPLAPRLGRGWRHAERRILVLLVLAITTVGLLEPLLWKHFEHSKPPRDAGDIVALVTVVLTVVSIVLAVFGVVAFQIVDRRTQERLERRGRELNAELESTAKSLNANMFLNFGAQSWNLYEEIWRRADPPFSSAALEDPSLIALVDDAIEKTRLALSRLEQLPEPYRTDEQLRVARSNLAFHLATRRTDGIEAYGLVDGFEVTDNPDRVETFAWVRLRFTEPGQSLWDEGLAALRRSLELPPPSASWRAAVKDRYWGAFAEGPSGELPRSLSTIVGEPPNRR
jgi:hypothetical protein